MGTAILVIRQLTALQLNSQSKFNNDRTLVQVIRHSAGKKSRGDFLLSRIIHEVRFVREQEGRERAGLASERERGGGARANA